MRTLHEYTTTTYAQRRSIRKNTLDNLIRTIKQYSVFLGHDSTFDDLNSRSVNSWLMHLEEQYGRDTRTVYNQRVNLMCVWRDIAKYAGIGITIPSDIRNVKKPKPQPVAWDKSEFARLIAACKHLEGKMGNGVLRSFYFRALIQAAYDTGLRRSDLFALKRSDIGSSGRIRKRQEKTADPHVCELSESTLKMVTALPGDRPLKYPHNSKSFYQYWKKLRQYAGLNSGAMQQIRRTGATAVYSIDPAKASSFLGHKTPTMIAHYVDKSLVDSCIIRPPDIYSEI